MFSAHTRLPRVGKAPGLFLPNLVSKLSFIQTQRLLLAPHHTTLFNRVSAPFPGFDVWINLNGTTVPHQPHPPIVNPYILIETVSQLFLVAIHFSGFSLVVATPSSRLSPTRGTCPFLALRRRRRRRWRRRQQQRPWATCIARAVAAARRVQR